MPAPGDLIHQQSTSTGTGDITLSAVNGKRSFNDEFGTGGTNKFDYFISNQAAAEWERGTGHLSAPTTLVRDTVLSSSNANAAVNFSAGTKDIANDVPAALQVRGPGSAAVGNIALWGSSAGNLLKDAGYAPREVLKASRTYYVRSDGSDSNTGLANTSGGAFLTSQKAVDVATTLDLNGYTLTIQIADGTYTGATTLKNVVGFAGAGFLVIKGNNSTPANVLISTTSANCFDANGTNVVWDIIDLKMQTTTGGQCLNAQSGGAIRYGNVNFGSCANFHVSAFNGGRIEAISNYAVSGGALGHMASSYWASVRATSRTITLTGTPAFSIAFAYAEISALLAVDAMTFSGSATGKRFAVATGAQIATGGGGANYLPGNAAGTGTNFGTSPYGLYS